VLLGRVTGTVWSAVDVRSHRELDGQHGAALSVALSEVGKIRLYEELARTGLRVVALLHTHPDGWVDLSWIDQANQISSRIGVWSLVVPYYGHPRGWSLDSIGVHVREEHGWSRLSAEEAHARIVVEE